MDGFFVNIACGDTYLPDWHNFDYAPHSRFVKRANLLARLPLRDNCADVVYCSHFVEHIPRTHIVHFLTECFRVAKPGATIRLVLPDFEEMCATYLDCRKAGDHAEADFLILEIIDQCVRPRRGGKLRDFFGSLDPRKASDQKMVQFVRHRTGYAIPPGGLGRGIPAWLMKSPRMWLLMLEQLYIRLVVSLLPPSFRQQNVSLATVGERHTWVYDFHSLSNLLESGGFESVTRQSALTSGIAGFPCYPLDATADGLPRKGAESLYIEARKPQLSAGDLTASAP